MIDSPDIPGYQDRKYIARIEQLEATLRKIDHLLRIPAAEYVPAISEVFSLIDATIDKKEQ